MKKFIADLWIEALESEIYPQGRGALETALGYCCLGVLCDLAQQHGVKIEVDRDSDIAGGALELQTAVLGWSGMRSAKGHFGPASLVKLNDAGNSFPEIARVIKKHWRKL